MRAATCFVILLTLTGCSNRQVYEGLRERERNLCAEGPAAQYEECLQRIEMDYRSYRELEDDG